MLLVKMTLKMALSIQSTFKASSIQYVLKLLFTVQICEIEKEIVANQFIIVEGSCLAGTLNFVQVGLALVSSID